ncbi:Phospholipid/glycerol acyltransferase [Richelia intracellularis]|nr:Phospholipid/glycerol acyltransferase [Richelia intracellularis]
MPVICLGNQNLHPLAVNLKKLQKLFNLPFLPLSPLMPIFILFPSMGVCATKTPIEAIKSNL